MIDCKGVYNMNLKIFSPFLLSFAIVVFATACSKSDDLWLMKQNCIGCHNLVPVCVSLGTKNAKDWKITIESMKRAGAKIQNPDIDKIADFLSRQKPDSADFCK